MSRTRRLTARVRLALGAAAVALLAGCAAPAPAPIATPTATSAPAPARLGDVLVSGEVTDSLGTYLATTIAPDDDSVAGLPAEVDPGLRADFDDARLLEGMRFAVGFLVEHALDGPSVDNGGWQPWRTDTGPSFVSGPFADELLADDSTIVYHDGSPALVRDGGPRLTTAEVTVTELVAIEYEGRTYLQVRGLADVDYRVAADAARTWAFDRNPGIDAARVFEMYPALEDDTEKVFALIADFSYTLDVDPAGAWTIVGYNLHHTATFRF